MEAAPYTYVIVGAGLAGASAVEGIREVDSQGRTLLIGAEAELPYDRPPLTKKLWFGKKTVEEIYLHDAGWYETQGVTLAPGTEVVQLDAAAKRVVDQKGTKYRYEKLLLATGGVPRRLSCPGGELEGISYYRYLADYQHIRHLAAEGATATVIGGGFIGSEIAAALTMNGVRVTMIYPGNSLVSRVFPEDLGSALQEGYARRGVTIHTQDEVTAIARRGARYQTRTARGRVVDSDMVLVGIGIDPDVALAAQAGLALDNGVTVDEYLCTSHPDIYAAGDLANFPYQALGRHMRVEHWDNAVTQGKWAGRNMAGAAQSYDYMPYFFSDLFDFGYEAVGEVESRLETAADWETPFEKGVVYYCAGGRVRGAMMCNVWDKVEAARALIRRGEVMKCADLKGAIR